MEAKTLQLLTSTAFPFQDFRPLPPLSRYPKRSSFKREFCFSINSASLFRIEGESFHLFSFVWWLSSTVIQRCKKIEEQDYIPGLPKEYYDDVCICSDFLCGLNFFLFCLWVFLNVCVCVGMASEAEGKDQGVGEDAAKGV